MTEPVNDLEDAYGQGDQKRLRLVHCEACGQKERAMQAMGIDMENLEADIKAKNRIIGKLKSELAQERRESPHHVEAHQLYEYWKKTCRPSARAFGEDRLKAVLARLNDKQRVPGQKQKQPSYTVRYIAESIKGASINPQRDKNGTAWNDLELICRNSSNLERFHGYYEVWRRQCDTQTEQHPTNEGES